MSVRDGATGRITAVSSDSTHRFSKPNRAGITLLAGLGVAGGAHAGVTVQHRSRVARDPSQPNLRQVHLLAGELLALPTGALLRLGPEAVVEVTGLRNPCLQIDAFQEGLLRRVVGRAPDGSVVRRAGIMGVVRTGGTLRPGDPVGVELPAGEHRPLEPV
ncbi:MOSC domain-containing protein [Streptomyces albidoflavus]